MKIFILICLISIFYSCASTENFDHNYDNIIKNSDLEKIVHVKVKSKFRENFQYSSKTIYVFPNNGRINIKNPWFRYFSDFIYAAFIKKGYRRAKTPAKAEIGILLDYDIGHPIKDTRSFTRPANNGTKDIRYFNKKKGVYDLPILKERDGIRQVYNFHAETITTFLYKRKVTLVGIDLIKYKKADGLLEDNKIFKMQFESVGSSNDLNKIYPIMIASGRRFIEKTLERPVWRKMNFYSRELREMVAFIHNNNDFLQASNLENQNQELYYMIPPTSRPRRLRIFETANFESF